VHGQFIKVRVIGILGASPSKKPPQGKNLSLFVGLDIVPGCQVARLLGAESSGHRC
jgi:hypothetical protein